MKYRALTVAREYGSGGAEIASKVAEHLGWRVVNEELLTEVSKLAKVPVTTVSELDERVDPWLYRIVRPIFGAGGDVGAHTAALDVCDADAIAGLAKSVMSNAYKEGNCVLVGRGAQCLLRCKTDVFHAYIYADWNDRVKRIRKREPDVKDIEHHIRKTDDRRHEYVHRHYGCDRIDPHLYDLMVNSRNGCESTARLIWAAMEAV